MQFVLHMIQRIEMLIEVGSHSFSESGTEIAYYVDFLIEIGTEKAYMLTCHAAEKSGIGTNDHVEGRFTFSAAKEAAVWQGEREGRADTFTQCIYQGL